MTERKTAILVDRGVVRVAGTDAAKFLQGLVTNDMARLDAEPAIHAGLLSPQGKIVFDFFVVKDGDGFRLETARGQAAALAQRLSIYKLRSQVAVEDVTANYTVAVAWGGSGDGPRGSCHFADPRLAALGWRAHVPMETDWVLGESGEPATAEDYHAHRIALGVPEGGKDYAFGDAYPHEAWFDRLHGASFTKGCFIGQEVVSRMEHRGAARKRVVRVEADGGWPLPSSGAEIKAGDAVIGALGSVAGSRGLALLRLDRVAEAADKGVALTVDGVPVAVHIPAFDANLKIGTDIPAA